MGQEVALNPGLNANLVAPAGGRWRVYHTATTNTGLWYTGLQVSIVAGGDIVEVAISGTVAWTGLAWRIA